MLLALAHSFVVAWGWPLAMSSLAMQATYFLLFFSAVAHARDRTRLTVLVLLNVVANTVYFILQATTDLGLAELGIDQIRAMEQTGIVDPETAMWILSAVISAIFLLGAILGGQISWNGARARAEVYEQAATVAAQAAELRDQAVLDERLRIARELHDVTAHHVSAMGVQAAAARRVMTRNPEAAAEALSSVEVSARQAVSEMRELLGALRTNDADGDGVVRGPAPGLPQLPELIDTARAAGLAVRYDTIERVPGAIDRVPAGAGLTLYRTTQEALANVRKHSNARSADVTVRVQTHGPQAYAEVEIIDDGSPRRDDPGTGLGQLGIRERARAHGGEAEIGPRPHGGYRVRVRIPWSGV